MMHVNTPQQLLFSQYLEFSFVLQRYFPHYDESERACGQGSGSNKQKGSNYEFFKLVTTLLLNPMSARDSKNGIPPCVSGMHRTSLLIRSRSTCIYPSNST